MGIIDSLKKREKDRRITRRAKKIYDHRNPNEPSQVDIQVQRAKTRGIRLGRRLYQETQDRKGQGREYLKQKANELVFGSKSALRTGFKELMHEQPRKKR
jgi:hypothetical protein